MAEKQGGEISTKSKAVCIGIVVMMGLLIIADLCCILFLGFLRRESIYPKQMIAVLGMLFAAILFIGCCFSTWEIMAAVFEESKASYFSNIRLDLLDTFAALGVPEVVSAAYGRMRVVRERVECDYFDFLDGKNTAFHGEYMSQYSFAEATCGDLNERHAA